MGYFQGEDRADEAVEFLEAQCSRWQKADMHPFLYTHNWWHLSLLQCEQREPEAALAIFDERLWHASDTDLHGDPQVQLNAFNLLWRLQTRGVSIDLNPRWAAVL